MQTLKNKPMPKRFNMILDAIFITCLLSLFLIIRTAYIALGTNAGNSDKKGKEREKNPGEKAGASGNPHSRNKVGCAKRYGCKPRLRNLEISRS